MTGLHDSLVAEALVAMSDEDGVRHLDDVAELVANIKANPARFGHIDFELRREALVRRANDDPTWPAWLAWICSRDLAAQVQAMCARDAVD